MAGNDGVQFDQVAAGEASTGLDALADRLTSDLAAAEAALRVPSAGADEVSGRAAQTSNEVASSYVTSAQASIHEMRKLAATLRENANQFGQMESDNVAGMNSAATGPA